MTETPADDARGFPGRPGFGEYRGDIEQVIMPSSSCGILVLFESCFFVIG